MDYWIVGMLDYLSIGVVDTNNPLFKYCSNPAIQ
jgi:hypothetical protein